MSLNNKLDNIAEPLQFLGQWLLRAPLGVVMIIHGLGKFPPPAEGFANMLAASGIPLPSLTAILVCLGEIGAGAGVIIGGMLGASLGHLVTRLSGGAILVIMVGAYLIRHSDWLWTVQMVDTMQFSCLRLELISQSKEIINKVLAQALKAWAFSACLLTYMSST